jgi:Methylamine utilisation protein MauE
MSRKKLFRVVVQVSRFGLAALFLFTAGAKIAIAKGFATNVGELLTSSGFNAARWMWPATVVVIIAEIITAALLIISSKVRIGALLAGLLLMGFAGFALYYVYVLHGEALECGCFGGIIASQLGVATALRNLALLVPVLIVFFGYPRIANSTTVDIAPPDAVAAEAH